MTFLPRRCRLAVTVASVLVAATAAGCSGGTQGQSSGDAKATTSASAAASGTDDAKAGSLQTALAHLPVKKAGSKEGYDRVKDFGPAWTDNTNAPGGHNGCDTRDDILHRDLTDLKFQAGSKCVVASGTLADPYTGRTIHFERGPKSSAVQIDHMVALSDAWQTGARQLSQDRRESLANDPLNLVAADGPANMAKGDKDASAWLPANKSFDCSYVARQIAVKEQYKLWVTPDERDAMKKTLAGCPNQQLPTESSPGVVLK